MENWSAHKVPVLSAALSYYAAFSLAPLLIIVIAVAGTIWGDKAASGTLYNSIAQVMGPGAALALEDLIRSASKPSSNLLATIAGVATTLIGAAGVFTHLQDSLNTIWEVEARPCSLWQAIRARFLGCVLLLGIGILLLISLAISSMILAFGEDFARNLPGGTVLLHILNFGLSFVVITLLFGLLFKYLPDAVVPWRDVWYGAGLTSLLFVIGKYLLAFYLGRSSTASAYGAAGSLVIVLLWVYYSSLILFVGAEFTHCYAAGCHIILPGKHASRKMGTRRMADVPSSRGR